MGNRGEKEGRWGEEHRMREIARDRRIREEDKAGMNKAFDKNGFKRGCKIHQEKHKKMINSGQEIG